MESFWVFNFELESPLSCKPFEAEVKSLSKSNSKLLGDKWGLAVGCHFAEELNDHIT
jgi:hypothetical protein